MTHARCSVCDTPMLSSWAWDHGVRREGFTRYGARGMCRKHYMRMRRHGDTERRVPRPSRRPGPWSESRSRAEVLEEYAVVRDHVGSIREAAERMGMSFSALDLALYRARKAGIPGAEPPLAQIYRRMAS